MTNVPGQTWSQKIRTLWSAGEIHGIELLFDTLLLALRYVSLSYWAKDIWLNFFLCRGQISDERKRRACRDNLIDGYCIAQLLVLLVVLFWFRFPTASSSVAGYVLFEMYLNLLSIFFLPRQKEIGLLAPTDRPSAVNEPSTSVERNILLLFVNVLQLTLAFAVFYRNAIPGLVSSRAFYNSILVFGTLATPSGAPSGLVATQICLDFLLVAAILGSFVGQAGPFAKR